MGLSTWQLLRDRGLRDLDHPTWGGPGWKVFLDAPDAVRRTIGYVERNPFEIGLPAQTAVSPHLCVSAR